MFACFQDGAVAPCYIITAFFFVEQARHTRATGDLKLGGSADKDDEDGGCVDVISGQTTRGTVSWR